MLNTILNGGHWVGRSIKHNACSEIPESIQAERVKWAREKMKSTKSMKSTTPPANFTQQKDVIKLHRGMSSDVT